MPSTLTKNGDFLEVKLEGRWAEVQDDKEKVKAIPGRRWNPENKTWVLPAEPEIADRILRTVRPDASDELVAWVRESMVSAEANLTTPLPDDAELAIPWAARRMPWQPEVVNDETVVGLLDYQRAAVDAMAKSGRMLLADDMGLGKTLQAISAVEEFSLRNGQADGPRLIIAPASVLGSWERELKRWLDNPNVVIVNASNAQKRHDQLIAGIKSNAWVVVNWEQLRVKKITERTKNGGRKTHIVMKEPLFQYPQSYEWDLPLTDWTPAHFAKAEREFKGQPGWFAVVADEIHRAKNRTSQQTKGLHRITGQCMFGLTGTPILNSPDELWSLMRWLWPGEYHERGEKHAPGAMAYWTFYLTYVDFWEDHFGRKVVKGVLNPDALRFALKGKVIRRLAPAGGRKRIYERVELTPKQKKFYEEAEKSMWLAISKDATAGNKDAIELIEKAAAGASVVELMKIPNGAARFIRLQQILENPAIIGGPDESGAMDDFEQKFADSRPNQWIVFCNYKESANLLVERLRKKYGAVAEAYTGDVSAADRTDIEDRYQRGEIDVIVGTIKAMYQGITLTSGHLQYWLSRDVVPANNEQGEARQDRLGQQHMVMVYIGQAPNTVATDNVNVINKLKEGLVKTVLPQNEIEEA